MNILLLRSPSTPEGTFGSIHAGQGAASVYLPTLEEPWYDNPLGLGGMRRSATQRESCVPDGVYQLEPHHTVAHPNTWALVNHSLGVFHQTDTAPNLKDWGRIAILIHNGNSLADTEGCILVGLHRAMTNGEYRVTESIAAMTQLRATLGPGTHQMTIRRM